MNIVKTFTIAALVCGSWLLSGASHAAGWSPPLTISAVETEGTSDLMLVVTTDGTTYTPGCAANSWIFVSDTDARRARAYATIMAAITAGRKIQLWYLDTCGSWSYHQASAVMIQQ